MERSNAEEKALEIDLTKIDRIQGRFPFKFFWRKGTLKPLKGNWEVRGCQLETRYHVNETKCGESVSIVSPGNWRDYAFTVCFSFLSQSVKPDEGGVILYFRYRNTRNHYSFHFCISKHTIELWKRFRSEWTLIAQAPQFTFKPKHSYSAIVTTQRHEHSCFLNKVPILKCTDHAIDKGAVGMGAKYCHAVFSNILISRIK